MTSFNPASEQDRCVDEGQCRGQRHLVEKQCGGLKQQEALHCSSQLLPDSLPHRTISETTCVSPYPTSYRHRHKFISVERQVTTLTK
ncbi:hypothetical protein LEMLEM_LOCUS22133 [Lemmus lemmus]